MSELLSNKIETVRALLMGIPPGDWLIAGIIGVVVWAALWILRNLIASRYRQYSSAGNHTLIRLIAYLIGNTKQILFFAIALDVARESIALPDNIQRVASNTVMILILIQVGLWAGRTVRFYLEMKEVERGADRVFAGSLDIVSFVSRMLIWSLLILVMLSLITMTLIGNLQRAVYVIAVALAVALVALILAISAMKAAKRTGTRRPRAALASVVLGVIGALFSGFALVGFLLFWSQYMQYAKCLNGAPTSATQNACQQQFENSIGHRITILGNE